MKKIQRFGILAVLLVAALVVSCENEPIPPAFPDGVVKSAETDISADGDTVLEIESVKVTFSKGVLNGKKATLYYKSNNLITDKEDGTVWQIDDLGLVVDDKNVGSFGGKKFNIEMTTLKGLTNPTIADATGIEYNEETGTLAFNAEKLGDVKVVDGDVVAINVGTKKAYGDAWTSATQPRWIPTKDAKDGETVILIKDLKVATSQWIDVQGKVVLDMNNHTIVKKYDATDEKHVEILILVRGENGDLTIKNGTVQGEVGPYHTFNVYPGATLTIESGTYKCVNGDSQYLIFVKNKANLIVNGGSLIAEETGTSAIGTNGLNDESDISINGGEIKGLNYFPGGGTYTITDGKFTNAGTCIYQKSGTLAISGGTFTSTGNGNGNYHHRGDGYELTNDAVVVEACGYPNAQPPTIKVTGGTFTGNPAAGAKNNGILLLEWKANEEDTYYTLTAEVDESHQADCRKARLTGSDERGMFTDAETKAFGEGW